MKSWVWMRAACCATAPTLGKEEMFKGYHSQCRYHGYYTSSRSGQGMNARVANHLERVSITESRRCDSRGSDGGRGNKVLLRVLGGNN